MKNLVGKSVNLTCVFGNEVIYYDCKVLEVDEENRFLKIEDRFGKIIYINFDSIKQIRVYYE